MTSVIELDVSTQTDDGSSVSQKTLIQGQLPSVKPRASVMSIVL